MRPATTRIPSQIHFLEPPHIHDPTSISDLATLPPTVMSQLPPDVQSILGNLAESTSVAYSSYLRLQDLVDDKFDRLVPMMGSGGRRFSESAFFNYQNHLTAEKSYLLNDAIPDWRHKSALAETALENYFTVSIATSSNDSPMTVAQWYRSLQSTVSSWLEAAKTFGIPKFEEVVEEYMAAEAQAATSDSERSTPLESPIPDDEPAVQKLPQITDFGIQIKDFADLALPSIKQRLPPIRKDSAIVI